MQIRAGTYAGSERRHPMKVQQKVQFVTALVILVMMAGLLGGYEMREQELDLKFFAGQTLGLLLIFVAFFDQIHVAVSRKFNGLSRFMDESTFRIPLGRRRQTEPVDGCRPAEYRLKIKGT